MSRDSATSKRVKKANPFFGFKNHVNACVKLKSNDEIGREIKIEKFRIFFCV